MDWLKPLMGKIDEHVHEPFYRRVWRINFGKEVPPSKIDTVIRRHRAKESLRALAWIKDNDPPKGERYNRLIRGMRYWNKLFSVFSDIGEE